MDILKEIIREIPTKELNEFKDFIQKYKNKSERKDLELISLFCSKEELKPKQYTQALYGSHKLNTYQALRKRLLKQLSIFITQKHMIDDQTSISLISGYISIIQFMIQHNNDFLAWTFMKKAEDLAMKNEHYDLLNTIYNYQIEHASSPHATDLNTIIQNKLKHRRIADQEERYSMVYALVNQKLLELKHSNINLNIDDTIKKLFKQNNIDPEVTDNPKAVFQLIKIARSSTIANKNFHNLQNYIQSQYKGLLTKQSFNKSNHLYKLEILYMLCHSLYRSRNFKDCLNHINELETELDKFNGIYRKRFSTKTTMLKASTLAYTNQVIESIQITEVLLTQNINEDDRLGSLLNLGFYYFISNNLPRAARINLRIGHSDNWCKKKMGQEWVLKKNLMEIIIQYELENFDIALNLIKVLKKNHKDLIQHSLFHRLIHYIDFIKKLISNPNTINSKEIISNTQTLLTSVPVEQEDLQAMAFYSWLKSKIERTSYYEALMNTIN